MATSLAFGHFKLPARWATIRVAVPAFGLHAVPAAPAAVRPQVSREEAQDMLRQMLKGGDNKRLTSRERQDIMINRRVRKALYS